MLGIAVLTGMGWPLLLGVAAGAPLGVMLSKTGDSWWDGRRRWELCIHTAGGAQGLPPVTLREFLVEIQVRVGVNTSEQANPAG